MKNEITRHTDQQVPAKKRKEKRNPDQMEMGAV